MSISNYNDVALTVLIFSPLVAAGIAAMLRNENLLRWWTLVFTTCVAAFSLPLYSHFSVTRTDFQFVQTAAGIHRRENGGIALFARLGDCC